MWQICGHVFPLKAKRLQASQVNSNRFPGTNRDTQVQTPATNPVVILWPRPFLSLQTSGLKRSCRSSRSGCSQVKPAVPLAGRFFVTPPTEVNGSQRTLTSEVSYSETAASVCRPSVASVELHGWCLHWKQALCTRQQETISVKTRPLATLES